jgi:4-diphosphocytidyl-2-C-methyl-D-erythritol kinase
MSARVERAGAKVTLALRVAERRADGYHELDALVAIVDEPHDVVSVIEGATANELVVEPPQSAPADDTNLVWRARAALGATEGLRLQKAIPAEAGLGGGSADAAATLRLLRTTQTDGEIDQVAAALGADVPVCLRTGLWRMRGIGGVLEPVAPPTRPFFLVLATPTFGCSTAAVYRAWDEVGAPTLRRGLAPAPGLEQAMGAARPGQVVPWQNDLEPAARHIEPRLKAFAAAFGELADTLAMMCGSGSTHYVMVDTRDDAVRIADAVRSKLDTRSVAVAAVGSPT